MTNATDGRSLPATCYLCDSEYVELTPARPFVSVHCDTCGDFQITDDVIASLASPDIARRRYTLAGAARNAASAGKPLTISSENLQKLIDSAPPLPSPLDVIDVVLPRIADQSVSFVSQARLPLTDWPLYYLRSLGDLQGILAIGEQLGLVTGDTKGPLEWFVSLTASGWNRVQELRERIPQSRQAFVAMSFGPALNAAYHEGIKPALKESGYRPLRVDELQHNGKIDDKIVAELRRSGLVVADYTEQKGGVYFEAGYALGRSIPVIWCCREDDLAKAHFDTRQFNHIVWTSPEDLREKLRNRIQATLTVYPAIE